MSQGKAYTEEQREVIMESLKKYLQLGYSRNKACNFIGLDPTTLSKWAIADEALSMKLTGWENEINVLARENWRTAIQHQKDLQASQRWLESKERQDFGRNLDVTTGGESIGVQEVKWVVIPSERLAEERENKEDDK